MRILFIYSFYGGLTPRKPLKTIENMQFGISYLSSILKQHGHETRLVVLAREFTLHQNRKTIDCYIEEFHPQMVCFTAVYTEFSFIIDIARYIRDKFPDIFTIIGGAHVSLNPDTALLNNFDALCIGEGERVILELATQLEEKQKPSGISNLWIKHDKQIEQNPSLPFLKDLDSIPFPDREMWLEWIKLGPGSCRRLSVLLGRGCPFKCTYCCNHAFKELASGPYVRFRSPDNIVGEIRDLLESFPYLEEIYLETETIGANLTLGLELCTKLEQLNAKLLKPLRFGINLRVMPNVDFQPLFKAMSQSNFRFVNIGLESGSERIRKTVLNRNYSNEDVVSTVKKAKSNGLQVSFYNLIGTPGETPEDFQETVRINRLCQPDLIGTSIYYPYPGTKLHQICLEQGLLHDRSGSDIERSTAVLDLPGFSKRQISKCYIWFDYYVYQGHKPMWHLLLQVLKRKLRMISWFANLFRRARGWSIVTFFCC